MAGHSKWANIKHRKERADAKKGKIISRSAKEIISAVKTGGADITNNPRLRLAVQKARATNVSSEVIERNIKKASQADQSDYIEVMYELYGHGGVGIIAEGMTDNKNRLASEMRIATNKRGGTIAGPGSVAFNFEKKGLLQIPRSKGDEELVFQAALDAGADEFEVEEEMYVIATEPTSLYTVKEMLTKLGFEPVETSLEMFPKTYVECDAAVHSANSALITWLEGIDDIDEIYHNMSGSRLCTT